MQADALSRFAQDHVHDREDNQQLHVLGPQHFKSVAAAHYIQYLQVHILSEITYVWPVSKKLKF